MSRGIENYPRHLNICLCAARIVTERLRSSAEPCLENTAVSKRYLFPHSRLLAGAVNRQCKKAQAVIGRT